MKTAKGGGNEGIDTEEKRIRRVIAVYLIAMLVTGGICIGIGRSRAGAAGRTGNKPAAAAELNRAVAEQQRDGLRRVELSIESVEAIRRIAQETDSALGELRALNRGSGDILQELRAEIDVLEDYVRGVGGVLRRYDIGDDIKSIGGKE